MGSIRLKRRAHSALSNQVLLSPLSTRNRDTCVVRYARPKLAAETIAQAATRAEKGRALGMGNSNDSISILKERATR
jgi:hypothetical protein